MREQGYRARDKVVQKMARDGLTEKNLADGTEQRASQRQADFSFQQVGTDGAAGRQESGNVRADDRVHGRTGRVQEIHSMDVQRKKRIQRDNVESWRERESVPYGDVSGIGDDTGMEARPDIVSRNQGCTDDPAGGKSRFIETTDHPAGDKGCFHDAAGRSVRDGDHFTGGKSRSAGTANYPMGSTGHSAGTASHSARGTNQSAESTGYSGETENHTAKTAGNPTENAGQASRDGDRFSRKTDQERESTGAGKQASHGPDPEKAGKGGRGDAAARKLREAEKRLEAADRKLERAKGKLPTRRRLKLETAEEGGTGRRKSRLRFEAEFIPENQEPSLLKRTGGKMVHTAQLAVSAKAHQKVREAERDNVGVESAHKAEAVAGRAADRAYRTVRERLRTRPYRAVRRAEKEVIRAEGNAAYRKFLAENPGMQKKTLAKWLQKQRLKKRYAAAARKAAKGAGRTAGAAASAGKSAVGAAGHVAKSRAALVAVAAAILAFTLSGSLFTSCSSMFMGMGAAVTASCYLAEDGEINRSELRYTELEADLQLEIAHTERDHPGYDEYRYNIGEIGHNPYELMGYLSAVFDDFTYAQVEAELYRLFGLQYGLSREEVTEVRTYLDEEGEEQEYDWRILKTVLTVRPLSGILQAGLAPGDQAERYGIYMLTCGGRQEYGSPFPFPWLGYVTSPYGYRVHPLSGEKDLHRGIDIAAAEGTPIQAVQGGRVAFAGEAGGYGLCLVIEGEDGYQSRYAHCSSIMVHTGQEVSQGDVVACVGNTGNSTGPHLQLEVTHNGEYLNPYFFVDNGGLGYTAAGNAAGRPQFSPDPGEPMGDGTFEAMLEVAERYMGYPYVWGGSCPDTSCDCSGYVSYVINQSGAGSVGRQTAQGLCNLCVPVPWEDLQPGDLVFFTGTYSSATPVSHVGIYVGGGRMAHAGDPIGYAEIGNSRYWREHFYCGGRLP